MARGSPPPLLDDPDAAPVKMAHDEISEIHANDVPAPVFQPPPPPKAAPLPLPDPSISLPPPPPPPPKPVQTMASSPMPSYTPPPIAQAASSSAPAGNPFEGGGSNENSVVTEHWAKSFWRPAMGWLYMIICFMDFVGFPLLTIFLPIIFKPFGLTMPYQAWTSLTLSNGGLIHLAFGAILGVSAFTRGQEKIAGK